MLLFVIGTIGQPVPSTMVTILGLFILASFVAQIASALVPMSRIWAREALLPAFLANLLLSVLHGPFWRVVGAAVATVGALSLRVCELVRVRQRNKHIAA